MGIPAASAHGVASGNTEGAFTPLIFVPAVIGLALFLVLTHGRKGWNVLVVGGAGYVGSALVPVLLEIRYRVTVLDPYPRGGDALDSVRSYPDLREVRGDIGNPEAVKDALAGCDAVIYLDSAGQIDRDAFGRFVRAAKEAEIRRFILASSFAVYGDTGGAEATEETPRAPQTGEAKRAAERERVLEELRGPGFVTCTLRSADVCGPAPHRSFEGVVNHFALEAFMRDRIGVPGPSRDAPCIHIDDMARLCVTLLDHPDSRIDGKTFNAVGENHTLAELAEIVRDGFGGAAEIAEAHQEGGISCRLSGQRMRDDLGFLPRRTVADAVRGLAEALGKGAVPVSAEGLGDGGVGAIPRAEQG